MTIAIKPTASGATIEQNGSTILTVDGSGNITPSNGLYPKGPAFSAYLGSNQSVSALTWTKVQFNTELFDTNSNYDTSTYRFTPTVAGYYQVNLELIFASSGSSTSFGSAIYKNGSAYLYAFRYAGGTAVGASTFTGAIVYMNGSTDYIEAYGIYTGTSPLFDATSLQNHFSASLVSV